MAVGAYSYTNLKDQIVDTLSYANAGSSVTVLNVINRACRLVNSEIDLRSAKRRAALSPKVFDDQYDYTCPTDLKDEAIIDIIAQANRSADSDFRLVTPQEFDRKKTLSKNLVAFSDDDLVRKVRVSADINDTVLAVASFDSLTNDGGTWALFGDAENVAADTDNYLEGSGSVKFDISSAGGTTAGLQNTGLTTFDITNYVNNGSVFVWAYINTVVDTGSDGLTNFILRIGNDSSNYYTQTITTTNESAAFAAGWNLLRFDFASMTQTGTVDLDACDYIALYMTKETGKVDNGYRFDNLTLHTGEYHDIFYYSKYPWQSSAGTYIPNSTTSTDLLNADTDEFELFVMKGKVEMFRELKEYDQMKLSQQEYEMLKDKYMRRNRSQRLKYEFNYY